MLIAQKHVGGNSICETRKGRFGKEQTGNPESEKYNY